MYFPFKINIHLQTWSDHPWNHVRLNNEKELIRLYLYFFLHKDISTHTTIKEKEHQLEWGRDFGDAGGYGRVHNILILMQYNGVGEASVFLGDTISQKTYSSLSHKTHTYTHMQTLQAHHKSSWAID